MKKQNNAGISGVLYLMAILLSQSAAQEFGGNAPPMKLNTEGNHSRGHEIHCSRERSRAAWEIIDKYLMPFVEREKYHLPKRCRLHPENDLFRDQENHKVHVDDSEWQCGYCKKSFFSEKFLDQHFDNRHSHLLDHENGKCLADQCRVLHCDYMLNPNLNTKCKDAVAAKNHHLCEKLAESCFPRDQGPSASRLHEFFLRQFCDSHTCSGRRKFFPKGGKKETNVLYLATAILILMLLPLFYVLVFFYQRALRSGSQNLRRISRKKKPT